MRDGPEQDDDEAYFAELNEFRDVLHQEWRRREVRPPDVLYHYTSAPGAAGILKSGHLWATEAFYLNDESELRYAADLLRDLLVGRLNAARTREERLLFARELHSVDMTRPDILRFFVASMSASGDSLSQ